MTQQDDITQRVLTDDEIREVIFNAIGFGFDPGELQSVNADDLMKIAHDLLSKLRAQVADEHCSACNPQVFSVEQLEKDPLLVARLWRKPAGTDGSLVERILEHVSEYGESMASSSLLSVRTIARRNLEARIEAELADAMRSQDESPLREALSEIASAWSARTRLPEEDGIQALKDIARAALASAPVAEPKHAPVDDGICWSSKEIQRRQKEEDDARAAYYHSRASAPVAGEAQPSDAEVLKVYAETVAEYADGRGFEAGTVAFARSLLRRYAAPQASAENVRLRELLVRCQAWMLSSEHDRPNMLIALIQDALQSQPQADKDGGQQRAGDVSAEAHKAALLEVERVGIELAARLHEAAMSLETISQIAGRPGKDMETMDDVRGYAHSRARAARAALSAPQAEQGERDA